MKVGDRVRITGTLAPIGTVRELDWDGRVWVEWDPPYEPHYPRELERLNVT